MRNISLASDECTLCSCEKGMEPAEVLSLWAEETNESGNNKLPMSFDEFSNGFDVNLPNAKWMQTMPRKTITVWATFPRKSDWNSGFDDWPIDFTLQIYLKSKYTFIVRALNFSQIKQLSVLQFDRNNNSQFSLEIKRQIQNVLIGVHQMFQVLGLWWRGDLLSATRKVLIFS